LRATEGFLRRLFTDLGLDTSLVPDFSTLCKRRAWCCCSPHRRSAR
jgi:IS5 family transposase